jgi:hypothetical protein
LGGELDVDAMQRALNQIVTRHEILRTRFVKLHGEVRQVVAPKLKIPLRQVDLSHQNPLAAEQEALCLTAEESARPFDLSHGPLLRALLIRVCDDDHILLFCLHHIVTDGWSTGILTYEFNSLYDALASGRPVALDPLPIQYADFAVWQRTVSANQLEQKLDYWRKKCAAPLCLAGIETRKRTPLAASPGATRSVRFAPGLTRELSRLASDSNATLFMVALAAFKVVLHGYSGQTDIIVGTDSSGRDNPQLDGLVGFFINQLVLRTDLRGDPTFSGILARVRQTTLEAYAHQDVPFDKIVSAVNPPREAGRPPLLRYKFLLQAIPEKERRALGLRVGKIELASSRSRFDITIALSEEDGTLGGVVEYRTDLFAASEIARLIRRFESVLLLIARDPAARLSSIVRAMTRAVSMATSSAFI